MRRIVYVIAGCMLALPLLACQPQTDTAEVNASFAVSGIGSNGNAGSNVSAFRVPCRRCRRCVFDLKYRDCQRRAKRQLRRARNAEGKGHT